MLEAVVTSGYERETVALLYSESSSRNHISQLDDLTLPEGNAAGCGGETALSR